MEVSPAELPPLGPLPLPERMKLVETLWRELERGENPKSPPPKSGERSVEAQMAAYEEHLKETDWGHQPC